MAHLLSIVSHNVLWFQGYPFEGDQPGEPDDRVLEALLALYEEHEPDLLCLQEVQDAATTDRVKEALRFEGHHTPASAHPRYGGGIFWRVGRVATDSSTMPGAQRMWQILEMPRPEGPALRVANVHLTSDKMAGADEAGSIRLDEIEAVLSAVPGPQIIAGDFNEGPGGSVADFLERRGYNDVAEVTGYEIESTGAGKPRSDQIWIAAGLEDSIDHFEYGTWTKLETTIPGKRYLSDHLPLFLRLWV